jgi:phage-related protein
MGDARERLREFPAVPRREIGHALYFAQKGDKHSSAKALKGFGGASVLEIVENYDGNAFRAVYTVKFHAAIYVLHCFQKKSKRGRQTPMHDIDLLRPRLRAAEEHNAARQGDEGM